MAYEYDRFEREENGGSFLMGLLAGTVLGAGLGMLFAPKAGSELRSQLSSQREAYDRARSSVSGMAAQGTSGVSSSSPTDTVGATSTPGSSYGA
jgi:gas vesicle protein